MMYCPYYFDPAVLNNWDRIYPRDKAYDSNLFETLTLYLITYFQRLHIPLPSLVRLRIGAFYAVSCRVSGKQKNTLSTAEQASRILESYIVYSNRYVISD